MSEERPEERGYVYAEPPDVETQWAIVKNVFAWEDVRKLRDAMHRVGLWHEPGGTVEALQAQARRVLDYLLESDTARSCATMGWRWAREDEWYTLELDSLLEVDVRDVVLHVGEDGYYE